MLYVYVQVDWKPSNITVLVDHLRTVVRQQFEELKRSLAGLGELQLAPSFVSRHLTSQMRWTAMTNNAKHKAFEKLMRDFG